MDNGRTEEGSVLGALGPMQLVSDLGMRGTVEPENLKRIVRFGGKVAGLYRPPAAMGDSGS